MYPTACHCFYRPLLKPALYAVSGLSLIAALAACSFSDSSGSLSDSSGSVSESASNSVQSFSHSFASFDSKEATISYTDEVADYTYAHYRSTPMLADKDSFLKGVSSIAAEHGITNWEADPATYRAFGKGLKKANLESVDFELIKRSLGGDDSNKTRAIQEGFNSRD